MDPREILPHRPPFLFLDEIEELTPERGRARYRYKQDEPWWAGHFPGEPIVPGALQIETMAQLVVAVGLCAARAMRIPVRGVYFARITDGTFHQVLRPGDEVIVRAERQWWRHLTFQARASLERVPGGELVAEATIRGTGGPAGPPAQGEER